MSKRTVPLTDRQIRNAKPQATAYRLYDGDGLYLEVSTSGSKLWKFRYQPPERGETRISFGTYPEIPLVEARQRRQEARAMLAHGCEPGEARKAAEKARSKEASLTFKKIAKEWHTAMLRRWQPGTAHDIWHRLGMDILPVIGDLPSRSEGGRGV